MLLTIYRQSAQRACVGKALNGRCANTATILGAAQPSAWFFSMPTLPWMMAPPVRAIYPTLRGSISYPLPGGDAGVAKTMALVRVLVDQAIKDADINVQAITILHKYNVPQYDQMAAARAIYEWVKQHIRYVQDPVGKETVRPATVILKVGAGDCDDINGVLLPSLLGTIGITTRGVTVAAAPDSDDFSHIYAEALLNGQWVPLDAARPNVVFGQAPEFYKRRAEWPLTGTEVGQGGYLAGMAALGDTAPIDWVTAIGTETAGIIQSLRASPQNLPGAYLPGQSILNPSGTYAMAPPGGTGLNVSSNISPLEIFVGLGLVIFLFKTMGKY
jgi:transglutaminase superfamily protein